MSIAWREALDADADGDGNVSVSAQDLRGADDDLAAYRARISELENALDVALEAVRLHERQAEERRDVAAELEWRAEGNRLENVRGEVYQHG